MLILLKPAGMSRVVSDLKLKMRIVSLLPSATEIICALGLKDHLVAVSHECDYPPALSKLPRITSSIIPRGLTALEIDTAVNQALATGQALYQVDGDLLRELEPDLIVTQGICDVCAVNQGTVEASLKLLPDVVQQSTRLVTLSGKTFEGILRDIRLLAQAADVVADALVEEARYAWEALARQSTEALLLTQPLPKVLMLEWPEPPFYAGHWVPEMVERAGGRDVFGQVGMESRRLSWQDISAADPDVIIVIACGYGLAENQVFAAELLARAELRSLRALRCRQVYACDANSYFSRPTLRILEGVKQLQSIFNKAKRDSITKLLS